MLLYLLYPTLSYFQSKFYYVVRLLTCDLVGRASQTEAMDRDLTVFAVGLSVGGLVHWLISRARAGRNQDKLDKAARSIHVVGDIYLDMIAKISSLYVCSPALPIRR